MHILVLRNEINMHSQRQCDYVEHEVPELLQDLIPLGDQYYNLVVFVSRYGYKR